MYGEKGYLDVLIAKLNLKNVKVISEEINSRSLFNVADVVVTCGGTAGMEYSYHGVPVIIACDAPYGSFDFVNKATNIVKYHELLNSIQSIKPVSDKGRLLAAGLLFLLYNNYGIDKKKARLDCYQLSRGENINLDYFFSYISEDNNIAESHFVIKESLLYMKANNYRNLYKS